MSTPVILCVDDEAIILMSMKQELRSSFGDSFRYMNAINAEEALEKCQQLSNEGINLALVISDWLMPGMDGEELLGIIHERYPEAKSILITGHADDEALQRILLDERNIGVLRKPWRFEELTKMIKESLF